MWLKHLSLFNFKSHEQAEFDFSPEVNCFTGNNGSGKTNVLDAIHYLGLCKSYFTGIDSLNIMQGRQFFAIHGKFDLNGSEENIYCGLKQGQRKVMKRNSKEYAKLSQHIGLIPVVMIAPVDQELVTAGSEERRKAIDSVLCQCDSLYLDGLTSYNRILQQRNALLKSGNTDDSALNVWDEQLAHFGGSLYEVRKAFTADIATRFAGIYKNLTGSKEIARMNYISQLDKASLSDLLQQHRHRDSMLQYTSSGIHKDDLEFIIGDMPVKRYGSQGQQKSFVVALKLALYQYIKQNRKTMPLLLLDDIFEKLDDERMNNLLKMVRGGEYGQLFITDTHEGRAKAIFEKYGKEAMEFHFD